MSGNKHLFHSWRNDGRVHVFVSWFIYRAFVILPCYHCGVVCMLDHLFVLFVACVQVTKLKHNKTDDLITETGVPSGTIRRGRLFEAAVAQIRTGGEGQRRAGLRRPHVCP